MRVEGCGERRMTAMAFIGSYVLSRVFVAFFMGSNSFHGPTDKSKLGVLGHIHPEIKVNG